MFDTIGAAGKKTAVITFSAAGSQWSHSYIIIVLYVGAVSSGRSKFWKSACCCWVVVNINSTIRGLSCCGCSRPYFFYFENFFTIYTSSVVNCITYRNDRGRLLYYYNP